MEEIPTPSTHLTPWHLTKRVALPFVIFSGLLTLCLVLSWTVLLPHFTRVEVGGVMRDSRNLSSYATTLKADILVAESRRSEIVTPERHGLFGRLREAKLSSPSFLLLRSQILAEAERIVLQVRDAVIVSSIQYRPLEKTVTVAGDVRNVGPRSMTVLAEFVDAIRRMPGVASTTVPRFTREEDAQKQFHSPFMFEIQLQ